ncbi:DinB family protein [Halalkalibacter alkalisediminis]|uniref:DinB family protein n=1 Tax=Halalkalibacter alkalisediminis TaxID=935616 RepID=A0ABV6NBZ5_9BACI|nr:DinB family protein [Halalkalibacter alkalisediminis]
MAIKAFSFARFANISSIQSASPEQLDLVPEDFNNSIRWNAGHILAISESLLKHSERYVPVLPPAYKDFFFMGTSPKDWKEDPPSIEDILVMSAKQVESIQKLFENDAHSPLKQPFELKGHTFDNLTEIISFITFHEGLHLGAIRTLLKATSSFSNQ